jgi:hypothetical protein
MRIDAKKQSFLARLAPEDESVGKKWFREDRGKEENPCICFLEFTVSSRDRVRNPNAWKPPEDGKPPPPPSIQNYRREDTPRLASSTKPPELSPFP